MRIQDIGQAIQGADRFGQVSMYAEDCPDQLCVRIVGAKTKLQSLSRVNMLSSKVRESEAAQSRVLVTLSLERPLTTR